MTESWQRGMNEANLRRAGNVENDNKQLARLTKALETIAEDRFSPQAGEAMARLKRITHYHEYDKRDGGFLQRAVAADGRVISGDELHREVMAHYTAVHNMVAGNEAKAFPEL